MVEWEMVFTITLVGITLIVNKLIDAIAAKKMREQVQEMADRSAKYESVIGSCANKINELHESHLGAGAMDEDGSPKWWMKKSYEETLKELSVSITALTELLKEWRLETKMRHKFEEQNKNKEL